MNVALLLANWIKVLKQTQLGHEIVAKKYMKLPVWRCWNLLRNWIDVYKKTHKPQKSFRKTWKTKVANLSSIMGI